MTEDTHRAGEGAGRRRRPTVTAALLLALGAALLWASSRMTWVTAVSSDGLGIDRVDDLEGGRWAAALTPLALVLLAAVAAVFAVRGLALRLVALVVAAVAVAAAIPAVRLLTGGADPEDAAGVAELPDRASVTAVEVSPLPAILVLGGVVAVLAAAVVLWRTPREQAGLSSKYDAPAARREAATRRAENDEPLSERGMWDALDAGEDPTDDAGEDDSDTRR
ncbi:TIGR02234 family membrane protein [Rhodococcus sp. NPDC047139]|uniref:TIGR02234 family membrane protein n=1 Tax=Rhodococcus sp. NPDC047139 TaxID=3155141 RepID=UPI0033F77C88